MACSRAHAIKAALVAGFLLLLLNIFGPRLDGKLEKTSSVNVVQKSGSLQWPKRTRSSSIITTTKSHLNNSLAAIPPTLNNINSNLTILSSTQPNITQSHGNETMNLVTNNINNNNNNNHNNKTELSSISQQNITVTRSTEKHEESTKSSFFNSLMTTLGLNECPPIPPNLDGPIEVNLTTESLEIVEKRLSPKLLPGGWFKPTECNARDRVAIIVPYRDRAYHLPIFLKNLHPLLMKQQIEYGIFIVEQSSGSLFNRAELMNIGYIEAQKLANWDCFVFHDVDLLPLDDRNLYTCPDQPRHMSVAVDTLSFKLPYGTLFGGVSAMTVKQFETVNGFSNSFWGWGGEDDDMSNRLKHAGFHIARYPVNIARYTMLSHKKEKANPRRYEIMVNGVKRIETDGLNSLKYKLRDLKKKPLFTWILAEINQETAS